MKKLVVLLMCLFCVACTTVPQQGTVVNYNISKFDKVINKAEKENFVVTQKFENIEQINTFVNKVPYVADKTDEWKTPKQFFSNGGDCEDYAIAKYEIAKENGIPEQNMRIAIVLDKQKILYHAILLVQEQNTTLVLDNQSKEVKTIEQVSSRYKMIYAVNKINTITY